MKIEHSQEFINYLVQRGSTPGAAIGTTERLRQAKQGDIAVQGDLAAYESFKRTLPQKAVEARKEVPLNQALFAPMHDPQSKVVEEALQKLIKLQ